jgi:hypothetical protein
MGEVMALPNISDMRRRELNSFDGVIDEIHRQFSEASRADHRAERCRILAGKLLLNLRERIENGEAGNTSWWQWYLQHFVRSTRDAQKLMELAQSLDPKNRQPDPEIWRTLIRLGSRVTGVAIATIKVALIYHSDRSTFCDAQFKGISQCQTVFTKPLLGSLALGGFGSADGYSVIGWVMYSSGFGECAVLGSHGLGPFGRITYAGLISISGATSNRKSYFMIGVLPISLVIKPSFCCRQLVKKHVLYGRRRFGGRQYWCSLLSAPMIFCDPSRIC